MIELTLFQRIIFGIVNTGVFSAVALLEGLVLYNYNHKFHINLEFLGIINFITGAIAVYVAIISGNLSDRSKFKYRRKIYILIFGLLYIFGLFLRLGGFTSINSANVYYVISYIIQVIGFTGLDIISQAWGIELSKNLESRSNLYVITTSMSFFGVFIGIILTLLPLLLSALLLPLILFICLILCLIYLPDNIPMNKRAFVPTISNINSTLYNNQFIIYLCTASCIAFLNTIPGLLVFFIKYCLDNDLSNDNINNPKAYYTIMVAAFVITGVSILPFTQYIIKKFTLLYTIKISLLIATCIGIIMFILSYISIYGIIITFAFMGIFSTAATVVLSIIYAETVDYDELLTGKKRGSSYSGVLGPVRLLIQIAGGAIPLMLMSVAGFHTSNDDKDDTTISTFSSTVILRIWCTLFMSTLMIGAYIAISQYKVIILI